MSRADPNPMQSPEEMSPVTSDPCRVATRGRLMALMSGGNAAHQHEQTDKSDNSLAPSCTPFWPGVESASFGIPASISSLKEAQHRSRLTRGPLGRTTDSLIVFRDRP